MLGRVYSNRTKEDFETGRIMGLGAMAAGMVQYDPNSKEKDARQGKAND